MSYAVLKSLHILVLASWLGLEIAVFLLFSRHRDTSIDVQGRRALAEIHEPIAFGPRIFWLPMLLLGIGLASVGNWASSIFTSGLFLVASGIISVWLVAVCYIFWVRRALPGLESPTAHLRRASAIETADTALRAILALAMASLGLVSLISDTFVEPNWLAWKIILFAVLVAVTIVWKKVGKDVARERRVAVGLVPGVRTDHERLRRLTFFAQFLLVCFWVLIVTMVWLAVAKP